MARILFIFSFLLLVSPAVFSQATAKLTGTVSYASDERVLHGATVKIVRTKQTAITDDYGKFEFTLPPGQYTVLVHQEGFADSVKTVELTATGATLDFRMDITGIKEQVTVSGSGTEETAFDSIATVSAVDSTRILERAAVGLGDVLDNEPGVAKRTGGGGSSRPVLRGMDGDRVKVSTDGISVGSLASQSGDHAEPVDTLAAERIEIVKGPATLLYGSNAIGGVVNTISGHDEGAHPGVRGYFSTLGGTNNSQGAVSAGLEYGYKNWTMWWNGSGQRTGDYKAGGNFGTVENTFTRNASGTVGLGYFAKKAFFNASYSFYQNRYGIPLDFNEPAPEERELRMWRNNVKFNVGFHDLESFITGGKFTVDLSNYRHQEIHEGDVGTTFRNKVSSIRALFDQKTVGKWSGRFGFDAFHRDYSTIGDEVLINGPVKQDEFSVFGLQEFKFERMSFQLGGRIENNRYLPSDPGLPGREFTGFSGAAGVRFDLWKGDAFVANYTHAYRAPALEELYNHGPHDGTLSFEIGNPNLKPETNNGVDFSLRHQSGKFRGEANVYYYAMKNFVFLAPTGADDPGSGLPIAEYLQGDSRFAGTELSLDYAAHKYVNILTGLDYVNAELSDGRPLPRIAPLRGRVGLDVHYKEFSVRPEFVAVADQDRVFANETRTPGYGVFNVAANYVIPSKHFAHIFSVNAYNLGNRLYYNHISFIKDISPEIGRGVRFGYTVRFF